MLHIRLLLLAASLIYTLFIVAVTLYPFEYCARLGGEGPLSALIQSAFRQPEERDFVLNVLFFVPLGFLVFPAINVRFAFVSRLLIVFIFGATISTAIEITQYFVGRNTSVFDIGANALGALLGALANQFLWRLWAKKEAYFH